MALNECPIPQYSFRQKPAWLPAVPGSSARICTRSSCGPSGCLARQPPAGSPGSCSSAPTSVQASCKAVRLSDTRENRIAADMRAFAGEMLVVFNSATNRTTNGELRTWRFCAAELIKAGET